MIAVVEMPQGTRFKIEMSAPNSNYLGVPMAGRVLPITVPYTYGYLLGRPAPDGDLEDVFIIGRPEDVWSPGMTIPVKLIGKFVCMDNGVSDDKHVAILEGDDSPTLEQLMRIEYYLTSYKEGFEVLDYVSASPEEG